MIPDKAKRITLLDGYFIASLVSISLILVANISFHSLAFVYLAIVAVLALLAYATTIYDEDGSLRGFWVMGLLSLLPYPFVDYLFEARLKLVTYLTDDPRVIATPPYVFLYWLFGILLFGYCYHRVLVLTGREWGAGLATGLFAAISSTFVENLFNAMGFYHNTGSYLLIGYIPLFIPLGYLVTFSLMPLYLRYRYLTGLLLYAFAGVSWWIFYQLTSWVASTSGG